MRCWDEEDLFLLWAGDEVEGRELKDYGSLEGNHNKIFWKGRKEGVAWVGVLVYQKSIESVIEVKRVN